MTTYNLYGISDLHLSGIPPYKPMTHFGTQYDNYMERIEAGFQSLPQNAIVLNCGDISWAINREEALQDFKWLNSFGVKVVNTLGNHDYYWGKKGAAFMSGWAYENNLDNIYFADHQQLFTLGFAHGLRMTAVKGSERFTMHEFDPDKLPNGHKKTEEITPRHWDKYMRRLEAALLLRPDILVSHIPPFNADGSPNEMTALIQRSSVSMILYGHRHASIPTKYENGLVDGKLWRNLLAERNNFCPVYLGEIHEDGTKILQAGNDRFVRTVPVIDSIKIDGGIGTIERKDDVCQC